MAGGRSSWACDGKSGAEFMCEGDGGRVEEPPPPPRGAFLPWRECRRGTGGGGLARQEDEEGEVGVSGGDWWVWLEGSEFVATGGIPLGCPSEGW